VITSDGEGLTSTEAEAVQRWHDAIMSVAIDEMTHLILVANLTLAIGGRPHRVRFQAVDAQARSPLLADRTVNTVSRLVGFRHTGPSQQPLFPLFCVMTRSDGGMRRANRSDSNLQSIWNTNGDQKLSQQITARPIHRAAQPPKPRVAR
jgi:hypothetical protein